jgi:hypothetical protein
VRSMRCILEQCLRPASDKKASGCALLGDCGASIALKASGLVTVTSIPDTGICSSGLRPRAHGRRLRGGWEHELSFPASLPP